MSIIVCHYHTDQRAEFTCAKCQRSICHKCKYNDLCSICHYSSSSYLKTICAFIGATLFFSPFFGGAVLLIAAIINSGFFWFLILFGIAWIGGVLVGYASVFGGFIKDIIKIRKERLNRRAFRNLVGVDRRGNRVSLYSVSSSKSEIVDEIPFDSITKSHHPPNVLVVENYGNMSQVEISPLLPYIPMNQVFCYKCGKNLPADALYCLQCGVHLDYSRLQE